MNVYEFITPSDPITFKTDDDKIAFVCAIALGNGKALCTNVTTGQDLHTNLMFSQDPFKEIEDFLGIEYYTYCEANRPKMAECFNSFAYGTVETRQIFDDACDAITDAEKLKEFKEKHENYNRTSSSRWVHTAWRYAKNLSKKLS